MDISGFKEQNKTYEELLPQVKFFIRYLKEKNLYAKYRKNIKNPKTYNQFQKSIPNWSFKLAVSTFGVANLISRLMAWAKTEEGSNYWLSIHNDFKDAFKKEFPE